MLFATTLAIVLACALPGVSSAQICQGDLYVAVTGDPALADGSAGNPYRTITPAVAHAREIRSICAVPIIIHVGPGDYFGSAIAGSATVDALPLVIDVPDLDLRGSTALDTDAGGLPTGSFSNGTTFTLPAGPPDDTGALSALFIVTPNDSGVAANNVTIEGFVLTANGGVSNDDGTYLTIGIAIDKATNFVCRNNIASGFESGLLTRASSGLAEANYVTHTYFGIGFSGGNATYPVSVTATRNRAIENGEAGLALGATGDIAFPFIPNKPPQPTDSTVFDALDNALVTYNDLSDQAISGIRIIAISQNPSPSSLTSNKLTATISNNTLNNNYLGVMMDAGFPNRTASGIPLPFQYTTSQTITFQNNTINNSTASTSLLTFTRYYAALHPQELLIPQGTTDGGSTFRYLQNSTYRVTHTGELDGLWIDHPEQDPVDCRTLCNQLKINGVVYPPPIRSAGLGPAFLQSFLPTAPFASACPPPLPECEPRL